MFRSRTGSRHMRRPGLESLEPRLPLTASAAWSALADTFREDQILVRFDSQTALLPEAVAGTTIGPALQSVERLHAVQLQPGVSAADAIAAYAALPNVVYAQPDYALQLMAAPNDPLFDLQYALNNNGPAGAAKDADIDALEAWDVRHDAEALIVGVIDTGVDYQHTDLAANIWSNGGEIPGNGRDDDGNGYIDDVRGWDFANDDNDPADDNGHGTHVAGIIGAVGDNGRGVSGVAWHVQLMPLKFMDAGGKGFVSDAIAALDYARRNGARIVNNSWNGGGYSQPLADAIGRFEQSGGVFVAAAGNSSDNNDRTPSYPASYPNSNVLSVAASDASDQLASFSNYGPTQVDLAAPGVRVLSTLPGDRYGYMSGTSMAAPQVSGALAVLWAQHPSWNYQQVMHQLMRTADPLLKNYVAAGRVNLAAALATPVTYPLATAPAEVRSTSWLGPDRASLSAARLTFDKPVDPAALRVADFRLSGPLGEIPILSLSVDSSRELVVRFATQQAPGTYSLQLAASDVAPAYRSSTQLRPPLTVQWKGSVPLRDARADRRGRTTIAFRVDRSAVIEDVNLRLDLSHRRTEDLRITLRSPSGASVVVWDRQASGKSGLQTTWDDELPERGDGWTAGPAVTPLRGLDGGDTQGIWRLTIEDFSRGVSGVLRGIELQIASSEPANSANFLAASPATPPPSSNLNTPTNRAAFADAMQDAELAEPRAPARLLQAGRRATPPAPERTRPMQRSQSVLDELFSQWSEGSASVSAPWSPSFGR